MPHDYGHGTDRLAFEERGFLSRLHALMVNEGFRGRFLGTEPVDLLFGLLREENEGGALIRRFAADFGDGNFTDEDRTGLETVRIAPAFLYQEL